MSWADSYPEGISVLTLPNFNRSSPKSPRHLPDLSSSCRARIVPPASFNLALPTIVRSWGLRYFRSPATWRLASSLAVLNLMGISGVNPPSTNAEDWIFPCHLPRSIWKLLPIILPCGRLIVPVPTPSIDAGWNDWRLPARLNFPLNRPLIWGLNLASCRSVVVNIPCQLLLAIVSRFDWISPAASLILPRPCATIFSGLNLVKLLPLRLKFPLIIPAGNWLLVGTSSVGTSCWRSIAWLLRLACHLPRSISNWLAVICPAANCKFKRPVAWMRSRSRSLLSPVAWIVPPNLPR